MGDPDRGATVGRVVKLVDEGGGGVGSGDPRIRAMHDSVTQISRDPVWTVMQTAIKDGQLDADLDEPTAAAHTLGPILYQCLFDNRPISAADVERTVDVFLTAFAK